MLLSFLLLRRSRLQLVSGYSFTRVPPGATDFFVVGIIIVFFSSLLVSSSTNQLTGNLLSAAALLAFVFIEHTYVHLVQHSHCSLVFVQFVHGQHRHGPLMGVTVLGLEHPAYPPVLPCQLIVLFGGCISSVACPSRNWRTC